VSIDPNGIPRYAEYPAEIDPPEPDEDPTRPATERLRAVARLLGMRYTRGYRIGAEGRRINADNVTTLYPACVTFEEDEDGHLWCEDALSVRQALAMGLVVE
jgi:hypothetical protein